MGVGADEELAIGAGAVVVASAFVCVAAAAVVSAAADVDAAAVVSAAVVSDVVMVSIAADSGNECESVLTFGRDDRTMVHVLLFSMNFGAEFCFGDSSGGSENGSSGAPLRTETCDDDSDECFFGY
ncbi:unnamed protein product [Closterium sp. NIES-54]